MLSFLTFRTRGLTLFIFETQLNLNSKLQRAHVIIKSKMIHSFRPTTLYICIVAIKRFVHRTALANGCRELEHP